MFYMDDKPSLYKIDIKDYGLNKEDIYYTSFFHQGGIHSRPIQVIGKAYSRNTSNYSTILSVDTDWKYIFKEKTLKGIVEKQVEYKNDNGYAFDSMRIPLIGKSEDEAKIRFILFNLEAPYLSKWERAFLKGELEAYIILKPSMVEYIREFKMYGGTGGFLKNNEYFVKNSKDLSNEVFFK